MTRADVMFDTTADVETPEHVAIQLQIAGPGRRALAYAVDVALRLAILIVIGIFVELAAVAFSSIDSLMEAHVGFVLVAYFVVEWFYCVLFEWLWDGRTIGKRAMGLRVVKEGGYPIGLQDALIRNLLRAADLWPVLPLIEFPTYLVGVLVSAADPRFRRLGDLAAGTLVIVDAPAQRTAPAIVHPPPLQEELAIIPAHPRLSSGERKTLDSFVRRLRTMHPRHAEEICRPYAERLAERLGVDSPRSGTRFLQLVYTRLQETAVPARRSAA